MKKVVLLIFSLVLVVFIFLFWRTRYYQNWIRQRIVNSENLTHYAGYGIKEVSFEKGVFAIHYVVGNFVGWVTIPNSNDKYLILSVDNNLFKFRIVKDEKNIINESKLAIERMGLLSVINKDRNLVKYYPKVLFSNLSQKEVDKIFKLGDVVIVEPVIENNNNKYDTEANLIASYVILRRIVNLYE